MNGQDELYSLLVPLKEGRIILPRACVAEVVRFAPPTPIADAPPWLLGTMPWNGRDVPIVSFEELTGLTRGEPGGRTRIAILHAISGRMPDNHFGVLAEGFPQLVRVNRDVIQADTRHRWPEAGPVLCQIRMINEYPLIPDFETIETMIADAMAGADEVMS